MRGVLHFIAADLALAADGDTEMQFSRDLLDDLFLKIENRLGFETWADRRAARGEGAWVDAIDNLGVRRTP